jgi:hypothetical protein
MEEATIRLETEKTRLKRDEVRSNERIERDRIRLEESKVHLQRDRLHRDNVSSELNVFLKMHAFEGIIVTLSEELGVRTLESLDYITTEEL